MGRSFFLQLILHGLCEWAAALVVIFWVARGWSQSPAPFPANLVRSPFRAWLMVGVGIVPGLLALLLYPLLKQFFAEAGGIGIWILLSYGLSVLYGALVGLASSCCSAPTGSQREFRFGLSATISAIVLLSLYLLNSLLLFNLSLRPPRFVHDLMEMVLPVVVLLVARSIVARDTLGQAEPNGGPTPVQRKVWPAVVIGFLPSALFLITFAVAFSTSNLGREESNALLWLCSGVSVVCCFTASILLFKRSTAGAITGGIVFLLLNAFIGFFFGCCASLNGTSFH